MIGPESSGKTTLSKALSEYFKEPFVPEFARLYLEKLERPYVASDLTIIAKGQLYSEDLLAVKAGRFLFCDTDLLVIKVWSEHIYSSCDPWILEMIRRRKYNHYFLCKNDFPWEHDPLRENPEKGEYFYGLFKQLLISEHKSFTELTGSIDERLKIAIRILAELK